MVASVHEFGAVGWGAGGSLSVHLRRLFFMLLVGSLGFVPMALSMSPDSEVQRPLASVVSGGLLTSTALTLFVLPLLYRAVMTWRERRYPVQAVRATAGEVSAGAESGPMRAYSGPTG